MTEKSIEDTVHDYAVAQIQSGKPTVTCDDAKRQNLLTSSHVTVGLPD